MKTIKLITLFALFAAIFTFSACEPDNVINIDDVLGFARFEITTPDGSWDTSNGRTNGREPCSFEEVTYMVYVLEKNGNIFPTEPMMVTKIGSKIVSAAPSLLYAGDYVIKEFYLTDALGNALFVVPIEGSEYAKYVKDPLELPFTLGKDEEKLISLEVVCLRTVDDDDDDPDPEDFGYVTWEIYMAEVADFAAAVITYDCEEGKFVFADDAIFKIYNQEGNLIHELSQSDGTISFEIAFKTRLGELIRIVVDAYDIDEVFTASELREALDDNNGFIKSWQFGDATDCLTNACVIDYIHLYDNVVPDDSGFTIKFENVIVGHSNPKKARISITNWMTTAQRIKLKNKTTGKSQYLDLEAGETLWLTVDEEGTYKLYDKDNVCIVGTEIEIDFDSTEVETVERCDY